MPESFAALVKYSLLAAASPFIIGIAVICIEFVAGNQDQ
jgi:hypothetical protein